MKIALLQDSHIDPKWIIESETDIKRVCEVGKAEKVDAFCVAGDFFNREIPASDRGEQDRILKMAKDLQAIAPVFFIRGTPSHDAPGAYSALIAIGWKEVGIGKSHVIGDTLIMGMPEINASFIHAQYPELTKQEAIGKQYELVEGIINDYYIPASIAHKGSVHFMAHGHVSGTKFRDDQKPRSTDFMFSEEMLAKIKADYYQFGHIHLPQAFKTINGGYGGTTHLTWNDVNFNVRLTVVDHSNGKGNSTHKIIYDMSKPMRQKIVIETWEEMAESSKLIKDNVNIHIEIKCDKKFADEFDCVASLEHLKTIHNIGSLSKITTSIQHEEHTRVNSEEYEAATTTEDIYKIYNPEVTKSILQKVKIAEEATAGEIASIIPRTFEFLDMELIGSIINHENGVERIFVDYSLFKLGANLFTGASGMGKSVINGLINPFSVHLPNESSLKDLFVAKNSSIVRRFRIVETDEIITQKILIDPTLASPTAKFYMNIDGLNIAAENGNIKPFEDKVNEIFGSIKMFMACVFRAQKDGVKTPSLGKAKEADLREIFQNLATKDRVPLKDFAHNETVKLKKSIELDERELETLQSVEESGEAINNAITFSTSQKNGKEKILVKAKSDLVGEKIILSDFESTITGNSSLESQVTALMSENTILGSNNSLAEFDLRDINNKLGNISQTRSTLEELKKVQTNHTSASAAYFEAQETFNKLVDEWQIGKDEADEKLRVIEGKASKINSDIKDIESRMDKNKTTFNGCESENKILGKPCEKCGEVPSNSADEKIESNRLSMIKLNESITEDTNEIIKFNSDLTTLRTDYKKIQDATLPKPIAPPTIAELKAAMDSLKPDNAEITRLGTIIESLKSSETKKTELEAKISQNTNRMLEIKNSIEKLQADIKPVNKIEYEALKLQISTIEENISSTSSEIGRLTAQIESLEKQLIKHNEREEKIKNVSERVAISNTDKTEWSEIETAFSPKGIPALELDMVAPSINDKANEFLNKYNNRYAVEIITQDLDSKNNISEKFKIMIHDTKGAAPKNLPVLSGGQSSWVLLALQEAISYVRGKKSGKFYMWAIQDESDGAIGKEDMAEFYLMIDMAMDGVRKLISVSHSTVAEAIGLNTVNIDEFFMEDK